MSDAPTPRVRLLVADDEEPNRTLLVAILGAEGYDVAVATDGEEAVAAFEAERPDLVLLDVKMPRLDGFGAAARIRALPGGADVPIVFLTAFRDLDTFDRALGAGADDFLTKPVRVAELRTRVAALLRLRRMSGELRELYEIVRGQRDDLVRMRLRTERLMAFVVHDLKNPVNAIDLHAQLLLRDASLSARARDSGERVRAEVRHLSRMILDLLDVAKSDEGKLVVRRAPIDLPALAADVAAAFELRARNGAVSIVTAIELDPPTLHADVELVRRVLENLVENGVRHSPEGGTVRIGARRDEDGAVLTVSDEGSGVPAELRERIFDPYVQVETGDLSLTRGGRGLGLAFCRLVVQAHGGSIAVDDGAPAGAVFRARFPDAAP